MAFNQCFLNAHIESDGFVVLGLRYQFRVEDGKFQFVSIESQHAGKERGEYAFVPFVAKDSFEDVIVFGRKYALAAFCFNKSHALHTCRIALALVVCAERKLQAPTA